MRIRIQSTESIGIMLALCLRNSAADLDPGMGKNPDPYDGGSNQIWDPQHGSNKICYRTNGKITKTKKPFQTPQEYKEIITVIPVMCYVRDETTWLWRYRY